MVRGRKRGGVIVIGPRWRGSRANTHRSTFPPEARAQWGRWDAANDWECNRRFKDAAWLDSHFDQDYAEGYRQERDRIKGEQS
jgi:hypothetical protein